MSLSKLTLNHLLLFVWSCLFLGLILYVGRVVVDNVQLALTLDESLEVSSPQLQKGVVEKAVRLVGGGLRAVEEGGVEGESTDTPDETSPEGADQEESIDLETTEESLPAEATAGSARPIPSNVEVVNTTTIVGAASVVGEIFPSGVLVELKNGVVTDVLETELDESVLLYKNEYRDWVAEWQVAIEDLGWTVGLVQEREAGDAYDVSVVLQ